MSNNKESEMGKSIEKEHNMENNNEKQNNTTTLVETGDYVTTAYGSMNYLKCTACGYDEILDDDNFCPHCGRKVIN